MNTRSLKRKTFVIAAVNQALIELLAKKLDCPRGRVELIRGQTSRHKTVKLYGFTAEAVLRQIFGGTSSTSP